MRTPIIQTSPSKPFYISFTFSFFMFIDSNTPFGYRLRNGIYFLKEDFIIPEGQTLIGRGSNVFDGTIILGENAKLTLEKDAELADVVLSGNIELVFEDERQFINVNDRRSGKVQRIKNSEEFVLNGQPIMLISPHPYSVIDCDSCPFATDDNFCGLENYNGNVLALNEDRSIPNKCPLFKFTSVEIELTKEARNQIIHNLEHLRK